MNQICRSCLRRRANPSTHCSSIPDARPTWSNALFRRHRRHPASPTKDRSTRHARRSCTSSRRSPSSQSSTSIHCSISPYCQHKRVSWCSDRIQAETHTDRCCMYARSGREAPHNRHSHIPCAYRHHRCARLPNNCSYLCRSNHKMHSRALQASQ